MLTDKENLSNVVEAILFVSGDGIEIKDIAEKLEIDIKEIENVIEELKEKHKDDGLNVITYSSRVQMCSNPKYAEDVAVVLNPIREKQLTKAALETAAIVAYKQPVTRLDIEHVRGYNSDYALQVLMNFNLVEVVGRKDAVGKPLLYGTTDEFLKRFDLQSIDDLPDYEELLNRIQVLHKESSDSLYRSTEIIPEDQLDDREDNDKKEDNQIESSQDGEQESSSSEVENSNNEELEEKLNNNIENDIEESKEIGEGIDNSVESEDGDEDLNDYSQIKNDDINVVMSEEIFDKGNGDNVTQKSTLTIIQNSSSDEDKLKENEEKIREILSDFNEEETVLNYKDDDLL